MNNQSQLKQVLNRLKETGDDFGLDERALSHIMMELDAVRSVPISRSENQVSEMEAGFSLYFDMTPDPAWIIDGNLFIDCNQAAVDMLGYDSKQALLNTHPSEFSPEFQPDGQTSLEKADQMLNITREKGIHRFEWVHLTRDGRPFWAEVTLSVFKSAGKDFIYCLWRDISERKRAEETLRLSEERFRGILENTSDWVWELDLEGNFHFACGNVESMLGYTPAEILQMNAFDMMPPEEAERVSSAFDDYIHHKKPFRDLVNVNLHKDGHPVVIHSSGVPIFDEQGTLIGYRGADTDITEAMKLQNELEALNHSLEKKVEERTFELQLAMELAETASKAKSEFLSKVSHELRTPMHAILSFANLGLKRTVDEKLERYFQNIRTSGIRLTNLLDDLLDLSRLESGKMELTLIEQDLKTLIIDSIDEVQSLLDDKSLAINLNASTSFNVQLDQKLIRQVVINLLSNAMKFTPDFSEIMIDIYNERSDSGKEMIRVSVTDQGIGVPADQLDKIFEKFVQSSENRVTDKGTGLGLPISREIIHLHGGEIWVESPPPGLSQGSVFHMTLPINPEL